MIGVSSDSVTSHSNFAQKQELPFPILSDPGDRVRQEYGVRPAAFGLLPGRVTLVIDKDRRIRHIYRSMLGLRKHVRSALATLQGMDT